MSIKRDVEFVQSGILTIDEVRSQRGMPPITGMEDGTPPMVKVGNDVILLTEEYIKAKTQAQIEALQYGNVQAGNQSDLQNKIREARRSETPQDSAEGQDKPTDDKTPAQDKEEAQKALQNEMRDFRKYVLNRLKKKSRGKRKFETEVIPLDVRDSIYERLEKADNVADIDDIFDSAMWELQVDTAKKESEEEIQSVFDDIMQEIIDNLSDLDEEELNTQGSAKKYLLLLILLGDLDYRKKIDDVMRGVLKNYANIAVEQAVSEIRKIGGKVTKAQRKKVVDEYINSRMDFLNKELNRVTEEKLGNMFMQSETIEDIKTGLKENFALKDTRSKLIADNEFHEAQNAIAVAIAKETKEVAGMWVTDGILYDESCIEANNSLWTVDYAQTHQLEHIRCHRVLHPVGREFVEQYGGFDEE
jgi:hypothetical protein